MNIRQIRKAAGYHQKEFAEKMGISRQTLSKIECGKIPCNIEASVRKFCHEHNLQEEFFLSKNITKNDLNKIMIKVEMIQMTINDIVDRLKVYL